MNPIHEWLARVAAECGSPALMQAVGHRVANENSRRLILTYAAQWARRQELESRKRPA